MFENLKKRQKNSLAPLIAMLTVLLMPLLLSPQSGSNSILAKYAPSISSQEFRQIQILITIVLIVVGFAIWLWGSKKSLLRLVIFYASTTTVFLSLGLLSLVINLDSFNSADEIMLIVDSLILWSMNVIVFSIWYWLLDGSWAAQQGAEDTPRQDLLFTQQSTDIPYWKDWKPEYFDYLYFAFTTSTTFGPADVLPLSRRVKIIMIIQTGLGIIIVGTVAAKAFSLLTS